jgi:hypothetical protein
MANASVKIESSLIKNLHYPSAVDTGKPAPLSGASGIVSTHNFHYIIADNSNSFYQFTGPKFTHAKTIEIFKGELPLKPSERKKVKPDLESITLLPKSKSHPYGALILLPSLSKKNRINGAIYKLTANGNVTGPMQPVDFTNLRKQLADKIDELNIEAALIRGDEFILFNRGVSKKTKSSLIKLEINCLSLNSDKYEFTKKCRPQITNISFGEIDKIEYTITDATQFNDKIYFLAAAEDTENTYKDGEIRGSLIGELTLDGKIVWSKPISKKTKLEGLSVAANSTDKNIIFYAVSDLDADDVPSEVYKITARY